MKVFHRAFIICFSIILFASCQNRKDNSLSDGDDLLAELNIKEQPCQTDYGFDLDHFVLDRDTIRPGDSFGKILLEKGKSHQEIFEITEKIKDDFDPRRLVAGKVYSILWDKESPETPLAFIYQADPINYTVINLEGSINAQKEKHPVTVKRKSISGVINSSLSEDMDKAGAGLALIHELAAIYQWKIDFFRIQKGDEFKVIYNEKYINDTIYAGVENIEAAEFLHYGEPYYAFYFGKDEDTGVTKFYDDEAKSLQNFFLKAPVEYTRISSRFTNRRFHPVQKRWKGHFGTDYAAPTGTPIRSTADGVIIESSYTSGNGNYVKVRHNNTYTTQYLHMSKRKAVVGQRVKQGEIIGFVGQTGLATGPHVCYRFWVNGVQKDPYRERMPSSEPLAENLKPKFFETISGLKEELQQMQVKNPESKPVLAGLSI